mmetsp:Transcript_27408/g.91150  ORF Transcript_27408/g.91150 Transcript_27408/m.91150 type:complete len:253 (+) Transcript_27408:1802-2560(+)
MVARGFAANDATRSRSCSRMSSGWPCETSGTEVRPGRSMSDMLDSRDDASRSVIVSRVMLIGFGASARPTAEMACRSASCCSAVGGTESLKVPPVVPPPPPPSKPACAGSTGPSSASSESEPECSRTSRSGACVTIPVPVGMRSKPVSALISDDLPDDCVPITTMSGVSRSERLSTAASAASASRCALEERQRPPGGGGALGAGCAACGFGGGLDLPARRGESAEKKPPRGLLFSCSTLSSCGIESENPSSS